MSTDNIFETEQQKELPTMLNVLTILSFIGSAIYIVVAIMGYVNADANVAQIEKTMNDPNLEKAPAFIKNMLSPEMVELAKHKAANKIPICILSLLAEAMCLIGAIQMRKLKKQGYFLWLIGTILPLITIFYFVGAGSFAGFGLMALILPAIFIILYSTQLKNLRH